MKRILFFTLALSATVVAFAQKKPVNIKLTETTLMHESRATPSPLDKATVNDRFISFQWPLPAEAQSEGAPMDGFEHLTKKIDKSKLAYKIRYAQWEHKQLELIKQNTNRLLHLVNQLMDYRRAELGVFHLRVRRMPVHEVVEKNFRFYERIAQRKQIKYNFYSDVEGKEILCDPEYVELIENNLLSNAFK